MWPSARLALALMAGAVMIAPAQARRSAMSNTPEIALVADLPSDSRFEAYGPDGKMVALDLGWSYREFSAFWMPFAAWKEAGFVFYSRAPSGELYVAAATGDELAAIGALTGRHYERDYSFPYWKYLWGWIPVCAIAGYVFWLRRREQKRRDALGLM